VFLLDETDIIQALATLSQPPTPERVFVDRETRICSACLGLLQQRNLELSMQQARSAMAQCDYEFTDYQLVISLPLALQIRHRSFMYYLRSMATEPGYAHEPRSHELFASIDSILNAEWLLLDRSIDQSINQCISEQTARCCQHQGGAQVDMRPEDPPSLQH